jgi:hypothetical protein
VILGGGGREPKTVGARRFAEDGFGSGEREGVWWVEATDGDGAQAGACGGGLRLEPEGKATPCAVKAYGRYFLCRP